MQTIKYSKIYNKTTEQHNLSQAEIKESNIFGKNIKLYTPCNLNIIVSNFCGNKCKFCINGGSHKDCINDEQFKKDILDIINNINPDDFEITITGGEPTLFPERLVYVMEKCFEKKLHCRTFSTTGYGMFNKYKNIPIYQHMIQNEFIHNINISKMHYNEKVNSSIMGNKTISNKDLEKLAFFFKINNAELRVSCNLLKEGISNYKQMLEFIDFYNSLGIETIMFREIVGKTKEVDISDVIKEIKNSDEYEFLAHKSSFMYEVDEYRYKDYLVKIYTNNEIKNENKDIYSSIAYCDGVLRKNFNGEVLKKYDN